MSDTLKINEMFFSIQGEGTRSGEPCVFIRLTGCHLRCGYCDTAYAFYEGRTWSIDDVLVEVVKIGRGCRLVEITGGEPLLQPNVHPLMTSLCDAGFTVLLETSGACDIAKCDPRVVRIMDLKTPGSGEVERNLWSNVQHLTRRDEVKFVLCNHGDYDWMKQVLVDHRLHERVAAVLVSAVHAQPAAPGSELSGSAGLSLHDLTEWVLADRLPVRVQVQLHKLIWDPQMRGV